MPNKEADPTSTLSTPLNTAADSSTTDLAAESTETCAPSFAWFFSKNKPISKPQPEKKCKWAQSHGKPG